MAAALDHDTDHMNNVADLTDDNDIIDGSHVAGASGSHVMDGNHPDRGNHVTDTNHVAGNGNGNHVTGDDHVDSANHVTEQKKSDHVITRNSSSSRTSHANKNGEAGSSEIRPSTSRRANSVTQQPVDRFGFYGGNQYTNPETPISRIPVDVIRKRELKWLDMLENWEQWMGKRFKKVRDRCRKGIPPSLRSRAWQYLCGSKYLLEHNRTRFEDYLKLPGDEKSNDEIQRDLHRQFPHHEMFVRKGGYGQEDLYKVLKAYTIHNPKDGYCQAQAPLAAVLLMHMPAEQAFWCLVSICEKYLPGYYSPGLEQIQIDGDVLFGLLKRASHPTYKHLKKHRVEPILYMTEWFMCVFSRTLPWATVLRVWDMFLCEGVKVLFRTALVIFKFALARPEQLEEYNGLYEIMEVLKHLPPHILQEEFMMREILRLTITERDMEKEHQFQLVKRRLEKEGKGKGKGGKKKKEKVDSL